MSSPQRAINLKNDDPSITYTGEWTSVQANTVIKFGNFGPAFSPTLRTTVSIASFSFPFQGSSIGIFGSINIANSSSTNPNPTWECFIDGASLGPPNLSDEVENHWPLCGLSSLPDGPHELIMNVTSNGMPFYLDYISYRSSPDVSLEDALIAIENPDPAINYISGWSNLDDLANQTSDLNSLVNVTFIGIRLSWYGLILANEANTSSGEYSIDGGPLTPFISPGLSPPVNLYNQLFFTTPNLTMETHILSVKYTGESGQAPLTLDWLLVANGSFPSASEPSTNSSGSRGSMNEPTAHSSNSSSLNNTGLPSSVERSSNHAGIVGGALGSVVGVSMVMIIFFSWLRFYRKRRRGSSLHEIMPFLSQPAFVPPPQTQEVSNNHVRPQSKGVSNSNSNNPTSLPTTSSVQSGPSGVAAVSAETDSSQRPPSAIVQVAVASSNTRLRVPVQYEDSGIRLTPSVIDEEIGIPPTYTEQ